MIVGCMATSAERKNKHQVVPDDLYPGIRAIPFRLHLHNRDYLLLSFWMR
jgi:hypothetical protein